jgi:hypothetical protein
MRSNRRGSIAASANQRSMFVPRFRVAPYAFICLRMFSHGFVGVRMIPQAAACFHMIQHVQRHIYIYISIYIYIYTHIYIHIHIYIYIYSPAA